MSVSTSQRRDPARARAEVIGRERPEQQPWLRLLEAIDEAAVDTTWEVTARAAEPCKDASAPALTGVTLVVDERSATRLVKRLCELAGLREAARRLPAIALLDAAIGQDRARIEALAGEASIEAGAAATIADLATRPLLRACQRVFRDERAAWSQGDCPVCGAAPTLVEARGLVRERHLRCGGCGAGWPWQPLRCPHCDNGDHSQLGSLVPEGAGGARHVDVCYVCRGYLKVIPSISPLAPELIALEDLATIELDLAAIEREWARPAARRRPLGARVEAAPRRGFFNLF